MTSAATCTCFTANDLFAGPGGWDEGSRSLTRCPAHPDVDPSSGIVGFEWDADACATARAAGHNRVQGDLALVNPAEHPADGLIASPPCQGFSPAGKGRGREDFDLLRRAIDDIHEWVRDAGDPAARSFDRSPEQAIRWLATRIADEKSALILEPLRWAIRMPERPRWIAQEQVKTVLPIWEAMAVVYRAMGYSVWTGLVHSEEYGVPQTRTRAVLLASLDHDVEAPAATHLRYNPRRHGGAQGRALHVTEAEQAGLLPAVTMAQALGWSADSPTHMGDVYNSKGCIRHRDAPAPTMTSSMDNGNFRTFDAHDIEHEGLRSRIVRADGPVAEVEGDTSWVYNRPAVTMVGSFRPDVAAAPGWRKPGDGPRQKAPGSVRIAQAQQGALQSFPADYPWQGTESARFLQGGNAVPPLMAAACLGAVL